MRGRAIALQSRELGADAGESGPGAGEPLASRFALVPATIERIGIPDSERRRFDLLPFALALFVLLKLHDLDDFYSSSTPLRCDFSALPQLSFASFPLIPKRP